ncbi:glycosyl transferase family 90 [Mucilaginibacter ginkgonis]|uniref:Lipopolysaccharide biosynthesis protein n=1 Tax=Mucilaginibacter ginkgonis TaxID=2682091 RepID=A0A7T7JGF9_9SPHI|nr:glycosyl transferase family 90 [Mucilaginibacter ginkgonis]QQL49181.1 lipopolysaccharide biosynthesis protein [Mucilaginibacter ginkgonis]
MKNAFRIKKLYRGKTAYYAKNLLRQLLPVSAYGKLLKRKLAQIENYDRTYLTSRVEYYNKLSPNNNAGSRAIALGDMKMFVSPKSYNFDTFEVSRYFSKRFKANFLFGDATHVEDVPTIQKSRPVVGDNKSAVLLNLDKYRHFVFVDDNISYADKKDMLIGRGVMTQPHRIRFMERYFGHPMCDLGQVNSGGNPQWHKPKISIQDHLQYKFILSLEGNDVATNLKWIMSSNSIAIMPKPKYETWFMEGTLQGGVHYIEINEDYSDLEDKLNWYLAHESEALKIVKNANAFARQFFDNKREELISLLVLEKYFYCTGQIPNYSLKDG